MTASNFVKFDSRYVDGLRGISSLAVALYHTALFIGLTGTTAMQAPKLFWCMRNGYQGVPIFIVLSGFVLMLPIARSGSLTLVRGFKSFIWRRFRRIVPPYWAALTLTLLLIALVPVMQSTGGTRWDDKLPVTLTSVIAHYLLIHDFIGGSTKINGPMWSVAIEWQIYFLMPLLLLPLWRIIGMWWTIALIAVASFTPYAIKLIHDETGRFESIAKIAGKLNNLHPWFLLLFALGMVAAKAASNPAVRANFYWVPSVLALVFVFAIPDFSERQLGVSETLVGASIAMLVVWLAKRFDSRTNRLLRSRPMLELGNMSYSIYLIHSPLLALGNLMLMPLALSVTAHIALMYFVVLPWALLVARIFHVLVERHFMTAHQQELGLTK